MTKINTELYYVDARVLDTLRELKDNKYSMGVQATIRTKRDIDDDTEYPLIPIQFKENEDGLSLFVLLQIKVRRSLLVIIFGKKE